MVNVVFWNPVPGKVFHTRGATYTADSNGMIYGAPSSTVGYGGQDLEDLLNDGCVPVVGSPSTNFKNLFDGGDFSINPMQRNIPGLATGGTITAGVNTTPTYFADRWFGYSNSASGSMQMALIADTTVPGFNQSLQFGRFANVTVVSAMSIGQVFETSDTLRTQGREFCASWWMRNQASWAAGGSITAAVVSGTGTNQSATSLITGSWTGAQTLVTGAFSSSITNAATRYSMTGTIPAGATQVGFYLTQTPGNVTAVASDGLLTNGFQFELDTTAPTAFEHRDIQVETEICQRYAWVIAEPAATVICGAGGFTGSGAETFYLATPVQLRANPTLTVSAGSFAAGGAGAFNNATITAGTTHTVNAISIKGSGTGTSGQAALLAGFGGTGYIVASSDL